MQDLRCLTSINPSCESIHFSAFLAASFQLLCSLGKAKDKYARAIAVAQTGSE